MNPPAVYLICGSTGSGKTTYSKKLIIEKNAMCFSIDEWMKNLYWMDAPTSPDFDWVIDKITRCETLIWQHTKKAVNIGNNVILDLGFSESKQRNKFYKLLKDSSIRYELHYLDVPKDVRWDRVERRNLEPGQSSIVVTKETFDWMENYFQIPSDDELHEHNGIRILP